MGFREQNPILTGAILTLGVGCLAIAIWAGLVAYQNERVSNVAAYEASVVAWESVGRAAFAATAVALVPSNGGAPLALDADTAPDALNEPDDAELPQYAPLRYEALGLADLRAFDLAASTQLSLQVPAAGGNGPSSTVQVQVPLFSRSGAQIPAKGNTGASMCLGEAGLYDHQRELCYTYAATTSVCVVLTQDPVTGSWSLDESRGAGAFGCSVASQWRDVRAGSRRLEAPRVAPGMPIPAGITFDNPFGASPIPLSVNLTVRSSGDPFIAAQSIAGPSLSFGLTRPDALSICGVMAALACLLLGNALLAARAEGWLESLPGCGGAAASARGYVAHSTSHGSAARVPESADMDADDAGDKARASVRGAARAPGGGPADPRAPSSAAGAFDVSLELREAPH